MKVNFHIEQKRNGTPLRYAVFAGLIAQLAKAFCLKIGVDKTIDVAVHYSIDVAVYRINYCAVCLLFCDYICVQQNDWRQ